MDNVIARLAKQNIACAGVGEICKKEEGIKLMQHDEKTDLIYNEEDPYWAAFFNAFNKGWK